MSGIVVVGSCMFDFFTYTKNLPKSGETVQGDRFVTSYGGKGANQCVAAAKLGSECHLVARLGNDNYGRDYINHLKSLKIGVEYVQLIENRPTGIAQISVSHETGENSIIIVPGANDTLNANYLEQNEGVKKLITNAGVVLVQLETDVDVAVKCAELTKGICILNGAPAPLKKYSSSLITLPKIFCVNETEAEIFSKLPVTNLDEAKIALEKLLEIGGQYVIITLGANGAIFGSQKIPGEVYIVPPQNGGGVRKVLDTTGAGDAFLGALAHLICTNLECWESRLFELIGKACRAATESVFQYGTQDSFVGPEIWSK